MCGYWQYLFTKNYGEHWIFSNIPSVRNPPLKTSNAEVWTLETSLSGKGWGSKTTALREPILETQNYKSCADQNVTTENEPKVMCNMLQLTTLWQKLGDFWPLCPFHPSQMLFDLKSNLNLFLELLRSTVSTWLLAFLCELLALYKHKTIFAQQPGEGHYLMILWLPFINYCHNCHILKFY